jgi:hypothetical protein
LPSRQTGTAIEITHGCVASPRCRPDVTASPVVKTAQHVAERVAGIEQHGAVRAGQGDGVRGEFGPQQAADGQVERSQLAVRETCLVGQRARGRFAVGEIAVDRGGEGARDHLGVFRDVGAFALVGVGGEDEVADQDRQGARQHERHQLGAYGR